MTDVSARTRVVSSVDDVERALRRISHEILERNADASTLVVVGIQRGGVDLAARLAAQLQTIEPSVSSIPCGSLDVTAYRDDLDLRPLGALGITDIPADINDRDVILVDDVLYTGRTVRAALNAIWQIGRPRSIQLAVLVDRGHRELPIRPDYVGKNLPTAHSETVVANLAGIAISQALPEHDAGDLGVDV
jgi:pyrimidine operon attenuation protein/uracil phosphoribosyltransferase